MEGSRCRLTAPKQPILIQNNKLLLLAEKGCTFDIDALAAKGFLSLSGQSEREVEVNGSCGQASSG